MCSEDIISQCSWAWNNAPVAHCTVCRRRGATERKKGAWPGTESCGRAEPSARRRGLPAVSGASRRYVSHMLRACGRQRRGGAAPSVGRQTATGAADGGATSQPGPSEQDDTPRTPRAACHSSPWTLALDAGLPRPRRGSYGARQRVFTPRAGRVPVSGVT